VAESFLLFLLQIARNEKARQMAGLWSDSVSHFLGVVSRLQVLGDVIGIQPFFSEFHHFHVGLSLAWLGNHYAIERAIRDRVMKETMRAAEVTVRKRRFNGPGAPLPD
jgi:hypothetical protein